MFAVLILQLDLIELDRIGKQAKMQTDDNLRIAILCVFSAKNHESYLANANAIQTTKEAATAHTHTYIFE